MGQTEAEQCSWFHHHRIVSSLEKLIDMTGWLAGWQLKAVINRDRKQFSVSEGG